ncbi:MAG: hypothetical protein EU535_01470 [Promethearchaeota archaeon]|nr:MAG: hypothetical protein EU535_01470 [Candidatus Lokiarchaeota archaeon]
MSQNVLPDYKKEIVNHWKDPSPEQLKDSSIRGFRISTALHAYLYLAVMGLLVLIWILTVIRRGLIFFWPMHPMFGWGFACGYHIVLYLSYDDKVHFLSKLRKRPNFGVPFITHAWFYISINIYLIVLNILFSPVPWSAFVVIGWGIAFGIHLIVASLSGTQNQKQIQIPEVIKTNYCHSCGAEIANRPGAKFCAYCGNNVQD